MAKSKKSTTLEPAQPLEDDTFGPKAPPPRGDIWADHVHQEDPAEELQPGQLTTAKDVLRYVLGGRATLTLRSQRTGTRYTYNVYKRDANSPHWVKVMYGPDNTADYVFMGTIFDGYKYRHGKKSPLPENDLRVRAFCYMWDNVLRGVLPPQLEVWHEGRCCRCGRKLTVPESVANGVGPECATKM